MKDATNINPSRRESLARSFPLNPPHPSQSTSQNVFWNEFEDQILANAKEARIAVGQLAKLDVKFDSPFKESRPPPSTRQILGKSISGDKLNRCDDSSLMRGVKLQIQENVADWIDFK